MHHRTYGVCTYLSHSYWICNPTLLRDGRLFLLLSLALRPVELGMSLTPSSRGLLFVAASRLNPKSLAAQDDDDTSGHLLEGSWGGEGGGLQVTPSHSAGG